MFTVDRKPASAKPTAVEPNELIARNELALLSSSSEAISGRTLSQAGSKNCRTVAERRSRPYIAHMPLSFPRASKASGIRTTIPARSRSDASRIFFRSNRSTNTPANRPTKRVGIAATMRTRPTWSAEPVRFQTRMPAARSVSDEPMVETSCASHIRLKSRLRKMANIVGESIDRRSGDSVFLAYDRGPGDLDALAGEQLALEGQAGLPPAPPAAAV